MNNTTGKHPSLIQQYNCGPVKLSGDPNALYERHFTFDQVLTESETTARDKFEAIARSVRDVLSQRWLKTEQNYRQSNAKRVYYLSMEFLLGRALANNTANLLIAPEVQEFCQQHRLDPIQIIEQEPDAGLGNGGLGRLAACFLDSMAHLGGTILGTSNHGNPPRIDYVPLRVATAKLKLVTADDYGVMTARTLDVSFGD